MEFTVEITFKNQLWMCFDEDEENLTKEEIKARALQDIQSYSCSELGEWLESAEITIGEPEEV